MENCLDEGLESFYHSSIFTRTFKNLMIKIVNPISKEVFKTHIGDGPSKNKIELFGLLGSSNQEKTKANSQPQRYQRHFSYRTVTELFYAL